MSDHPDITTLRLVFIRKINVFRNHVKGGRGGEGGAVQHYIFNIEARGHKSCWGSCPQASTTHQKALPEIVEVPQ